MAQCEQCGSESPETAGFCRQCGQPFAGPDPMLGQEVLGRYRVIRLIGEGGMGRVYEAEQRVGTTARRVAVKTLRAQLSADPQLARRFFREAETIVRLTHPNTIQFFDFGELPNGTLAMVMEFIEGHSLADELARGALEPARADRIFAQICGALSEAHGLGIVHRDLKPDNILLTQRGGQSDFVKVLDFGIAKISAADDDRRTKLTQQGMMVGTPPYMSPEQFSGEPVDARSDIYSLGVVAYEMLTGRLPFDARTPWEWASKHLTADPEPLRPSAHPGISERKAHAIRRALAKRPDERPRDVAELLAEFSEGATSGTGSVALPSTSRAGSSAQLSQPHATRAQGTPAHAESIQLPVRKLPKAAWVAGAALVAVAGGGLALSSLWSPGSLGTGPAGRPAPELPAPVTAAPALPSPEPVELKPARAQAPEPAQATARAALRAERERDRSGAPSRRAAGEARELEAPPSPSPSPGVKIAAAAAEPKEEPSPRGGAPAASPTPLKAELAAPAVRSDPAAADLQARVDKALATVPTRVEVALGLYQAAAARYGAEQAALVPLRRALTEHGERRIRELLAANRCAQAQAFYRALNGAGATGSAKRAFHPGCPAP